MDPVSGILLNNEVCPISVYGTPNFSMVQMDDFSVPGNPNGFGLYPSPCKMVRSRRGSALTGVARQLSRTGEAAAIVYSPHDRREPRRVVLPSHWRVWRV